MFYFQLDDVCYAASRGTGLRETGDPVSPEDYAAFQKELAAGIPMMLRRRLLPAGRLAVGAGVRLLTRFPDMARIIFASRTGESVRCFRLLQEILAGNGISPMEFASCVHNGNAGVLSIIRKYQGEVTAVAGAESTLMAGLTEARAALEARPEVKRVLLAVSEENLESCREVLTEVPDFGGDYVLALALSRCPEEFRKEELPAGGESAERLFTRRLHGVTLLGFCEERDRCLSGRELGDALARELKDRI